MKTQCLPYMLSLIDFKIVENNLEKEGILNHVNEYADNFEKYGCKAKENLKNRSEIILETVQKNI